MLESTEVVPDRGVQLALLNCYALGKMRDEAYELFTTLKRQGVKSATSYG
jgi:pentatricopeptide repeat protein